LTVYDWPSLSVIDPLFPFPALTQSVADPPLTLTVVPPQVIVTPLTTCVPDPESNLMLPAGSAHCRSAG
jgi:hypothetical protein